MFKPIIFLLLCFYSLGAVAENTSTPSPTSKQAPVKAVLVTGASSGIGKQIALDLASKGFFVYAGARKAKDIAALSALPNTLGLRLDVTVQSDIDAAVMLVRAQGRGLFGLVNNAGVFLYGPLVELSEQNMQFIMDVNVFGPYRITRAFAPLIMESRGRITTIGSVAGIFSGKMFGPYGMTKHAMEAFSDALAQEIAKFDVAVSIVEPGNFNSNIMKNMHRRKGEKFNSQTSLFKEEIAAMANFTKSDRSHHHSPQPVANAVHAFFTAEKPQLRYLVTPNQREASYTIQRALQKALELNQAHSHSLSNQELLKMLAKLLKESDS